MSTTRNETPAYFHWKCRYCTHTYSNPIPCVSVSHRCPKKGKRDMYLLPDKTKEVLCDA